MDLEAESISKQGLIRSVHEDVDLKWLADVLTPSLELGVECEDLLRLDVELPRQ